MFALNLEVLPAPVRIWDLKIGDRFCLSPSGWNAQEEKYEIYLKITLTKCLLDSVPTKPVFSIPKIAKRDVGYKVIEAWLLPKK